jgi:hypothetical protein
MKEDDEPKEKLKIIVKTLTGDKHSFNVNYGDKIIDLIIMIKDKLLIKKDQIRLVKNETKKILSNEEDLIGNVLKSGDEVIMIFQLKGS